MKILPVENFRLLGTSMCVSKEKVYDAVPATNQPNWEERRLVFLLDGEDSMLLQGDEYEVIEL